MSDEYTQHTAHLVMWEYPLRLEAGRVSIGAGAVPLTARTGAAVQAARRT